VIYNFSWIVPDKVGGMGRPDASDLAWLVEIGVGAVVSLTERPIPATKGLEIFHAPIIDMTAPTVEHLEKIIEFMRGVVAADGRVIAHCAAGAGRTGTVLASYMVSEGFAAADAIAYVRTLRPGSIETPDQEAAVAVYAARVAEARP
jgi:atypical dual specificity phosphatase